MELKYNLQSQSGDHSKFFEGNCIEPKFESDKVIGVLKKSFLQWKNALGFLKQM
jgi:hypothetical protein